MATPGLMPVSGVPRYSTWPPSAWMSPERMRISVLLPQPEGPNTAINSWSFTSSETFSSTRTVPPVGSAKSLLMPRKSQITSTVTPLSPERILALGQGIEPLPEEPIDQDDQSRHCQYTRGQQRQVALLGGGVDQCTQAVRAQDVGALVDIFGDDARVPSAAGRRDPAGDQRWEDAWQHEQAPALRSLVAKNLRGL